ncbi:type III effector HrpK domain-containing protein [Brucella sp. BE17]|uniref:type III effector HrpK domain-containing protein n=1 Tax=Brucella sp. BE17 TaxID=3142977 RepID=UPI0031BAD820
MAKVNSSASSPVDPKSVDPNNTEAWKQAEKDAKDAGIRWEKPADDKRSAQEIIDDTPLLKNLGNQSGVKDSLEQRVGGDIEKDADAAYRAAQVLEHVEKFDAKGNRLASNDINNGEINGFTKGKEAKPNTEAGRLQDFGKYGFSNLKGKLNNVSAADDPKARKQAEDLGIKWERPKGDDRSAKDIIDSNRLLKGLGNQSDVKAMLKEQVGDFEKDANAAYRATQVLDHIEKFDKDGKRQVGGDVGDHKINGFTNSGEAEPNTEAGRLQDFGKYGFSNLKGKLNDFKDAGNNKEERKKAEALGIEWERTKDDKRSAKDIVNGDPLLKELGDHSGVRDMLKERVGDFYNDADAAYRATQVLRHVEQFDSKGKEITGGSVGNGKINGFTTSREAEPNTEAGRLQDFGKYGFDSLKGDLGDVSSIKGKGEDAKSYKDYIKANKDADEGSKQVAKYAAILEENYDTIREKAGAGGNLDADALQRYKNTAKGLSDEAKEALDFWSQSGAFNIIDNAKHSLAQRPDGDLSKGDLQSWLSKSAPKDASSLMTFLSDAAQRSALSDIDTSKLGNDVFENPGNYSNEEKAAVLQDLQQAQQLMVDGASAGMWKDDYSKVSIANRARVHPDKEKVFDDLNKHIKILQDDKEVTKTLSEKTAGALKDLVADNKGLKEAVQKTYDDEIKSGKALNKSWDTNMKDGKVEQQAVLAEFLGTAQSYQGALDIKKPEDIKDAIKKSDHEGDFKDFYENKLVSGDRLKELLKDNSFEAAASVYNMEVGLYNAALDSEFTGKLDDKLEENFSKIGNENILKDASFDDMKKAFGVNGGDELDEKKVKEYIAEVAKENPELFVNENGKAATPDQILGGFRATWDVYRQGTKTLDKTGSLENLDPNKNAKGAYDKGVLHGVSGLFLAGMTISRGVGTNGELQPKDYVNIIAGSVQTATVLTEGGMKGYSQYLKGLKDKLDDDLMNSVGSLLDDVSPENLSAQDSKANKSPLYDKRASLAKKFEEGAKGLGGAAGAAMGAYGIFDGVKSIRNGDTVTGALGITSGSIGAMAGLASMVEGAWGLGNALLPNLISKVPNIVPVFAGALGWAAAGVGVIVSFLPSLIEEGKHQKRSDDFGHTLGSFLTKYEIDGVEGGSFRDIPDNEWPGYEDGPTIGS